MAITDELDALIEQLDEAAEAISNDGQAAIELQSKTPTMGGDALDAIMRSPGRHTAVKRLRDTEIIQQFRRDLLSGLIRVEQLNQVLALVTIVIRKFLR